MGVLFDQMTFLKENIGQCQKIYHRSFPQLLKNFHPFHRIEKAINDVTLWTPKRVSLSENIKRPKKLETIFGKIFFTKYFQTFRKSDCAKKNTNVALRSCNRFVHANIQKLAENRIASIQEIFEKIVPKIFPVTSYQCA